jgi:hypothetical protein
MCVCVKVNEGKRKAIRLFHLESDLSTRQEAGRNISQFVNQEDCDGLSSSFSAMFVLEAASGDVRNDTLPKTPCCIGRLFPLFAHFLLYSHLPNLFALSLERGGAM